MKLSNGREVELEPGCILETEENVYIVCEDICGYRLLDMGIGKLENDCYKTIDELGIKLDYRFRRIVYDGIVTPDDYIDIEE